MSIKDKTYLVPKAGNDGSDLRKTSFAVSPCSLESLTVPNRIHKALMENKMDRKPSEKIRNQLITYLKRTNAWKPYYDNDNVFGSLLREGFDDFLQEYKQSSRVTQKQVTKGEINLFIPEVVRAKGLKAVSEARQNNQ